MGSYTKEIHFGGKKLVIWGKNATLDAAKKGRFFSSTFGPNDDDDDHAKPDTSLELHDLVLQNGDAALVSVKILDLFSELSLNPLSMLLHVMGRWKLELGRSY